MVRKADNFRQNFERRILLPLVAATVATILLAAVSLGYLTNLADGLSVERQRREAVVAVRSAIDSLARTQEIAAVWDSSALELRKSQPNWRWVDANIGTWLFKMFNHEQVYILDARDKPIYSAISGKRTDPAHYASVEADLSRFVDAVRGRTARRPNPHERLPDQDLHPNASVGTQKDAIHATDLAWLGGRPAAVSVMRIMPHTSAVARSSQSEPLLVSVRLLDHDFLKEIAKSNLITDPRLASTLDVQDGEQALSLSSNNGNVGYFVWRPDLPGTKLRNSLTVLGIALIGVLGVMMAWLARSLYCAMLKQHAAKAELEAALVDLRASEAQAQHLAFHDVLTGLPNRALLHDRIEHALGRASETHPLALIMLDLDRFKQVNDTLGHAAGDALIRDFSSRLSGLIDTSGTVARLGGDEFAILLPNLHSNEVEELGRQILAVAHEPFAFLGNEAYVGVSMGIVYAPQNGLDRTELMRKADIALYQAKADGRDCFRLFAPEMDEGVKFRRCIEQELRHALAAGDELCVYYQPQVGAAGGPIVGLEALVRWRHPRRGLISPESFIPVAEETGLISELGEWVLREACSAARKWPKLFVAVNLSPSQFGSPRFAERTIQIVRDAGVNPAQIELEVTETILLHDDETALAALNRLREAGFKIALDDFGTGYSSLSHLRRFEVDKIKIDRTFVQNLGLLDSSAIVTAVVNLAHALGLQVTAEGVETAEQSVFLTAAGCNVMQGFLFSEAVTKLEIDALLAKEEALRRAA